MTEPTISNRGFKHMDPVRNRNGGEVRVFESSNAMLPCVRLSVTCPASFERVMHADGGLPMDMAEGSAELTLVDAEKLRDQLTYLIENHHLIVQADVVTDLDDTRAALDQAAIPPGARTDIEGLFTIILDQLAKLARQDKTVADLRAALELAEGQRDSYARQLNTVQISLAHAHNTIDAVKALPEHFLQVRDTINRALDPACQHVRAGAWEEAARRIRNVIQATEGK